jgi:hypothetical protein
LNMRHGETKNSSAMAHQQPRRDFNFVDHGNFSCSVTLSIAYTHSPNSIYNYQDEYIARKVTEKQNIEEPKYLQFTK